MSLLKQSHTFLAPVTIIYFVLLHKTVGRVKSNFCVSYLLYLLWNLQDQLPHTLSFFQFKHPSFCQPPRWLSLDLLWNARVALCGCWDCAGVWQQDMCPPGPALSQFCVSSQAHTSPPRTLWKLLSSPLMAQCALWNQHQLLMILAFSGRWLATWLFLVISEKMKNTLGFISLE